MLRRILATATAVIAAAWIGGGCARYAPQAPPAPVRKVLEIRFTTRQPVTGGISYYIAFDTSGAADSDGPHTTLSGVEVAKNWSYYIRYRDGIFGERFLTTTNDADLDPTPFTQSERYYLALVSANVVTLRLYLDKLMTGDGTIWFNFITSEGVLTTELINVPAVDYLTNPTFSINTASDTYVTSDNYPAISSHTAAEGLEAADIVAWSVRIYKL